MVTTVGTENSQNDLVRNLLVLEHDAIAAYDSTIERLNDSGHRAKIEEFRRDHESHVEQLRGVAHEIGLTPPGEGDMKEMLTTGKVALAGMAGDGAILKAMKTNEDDTVSAYEHALQNAAADERLRPILERGLADERRHREWMQAAS